MKPILIAHPLKRIQLDYHSETALSNFESTFIDRYKQLHDELAAIKNELLQLGPGIDIVMTELNNVRLAFDKLQTKISSTELLFGINQQDELAPGEYTIRPGEINEVLNEFQSVRLQYWGIMVPMHKLFNSVCKKFSAFDITVEVFEKEYAEPYFRNVGKMEIDRRSFDKDMNEFRIEWMAIASLQDTCLDEYTEWARLQTALVNDSDALYARIKNLFQHISASQSFKAGSKENEFDLN